MTNSKRSASGPAHHKAEPSRSQADGHGRRALHGNEFSLDDRCSQLAAEPLRQCLGGVLPLVPQPFTLRSQQDRKDCLPLTLSVAALDEESASSAAWRHQVPNPSGRLVPPLSPPRRIGEPDTEVGILSGRRFQASLAESFPETANFPEVLARHSHILRPDISDWSGGLWHTTVRGADDPEKLVRQPPRYTSKPNRLDVTADSDYMRAGERRD